MNKKIFFLLFLIGAISLWQCARRGSPSGGIKDEIPPVLLSATPPSGTLNFKHKKIRFYFDELVTTKDLRKQLIISPPLENFPSVSPLSASRWIEIAISDTLKENTTYVFNFGKSIQDYNEGNAYPDLKYVFSTGKFIDSLKVKGSVADALNYKTDHPIKVMLYEYTEKYTDSLVYKSKPMYIANTDSLGNFSLNNIKEGTYKLAALKDKNDNYLFNKKEDKVGFYNKIIEVNSDTTAFYKVRIFKEVLDYKALRPTQMASNRILFPFEGNCDSVKIKPIGEIPSDFDYIVSKEPKKDSLHFWFSSKKVDSLRLTIKNSEKIDTFNIRLRKMKPDSLTLTANFSGEIPFEKHFGWNSNIPITKTDISKIKVFHKDSLEIPFKTQLNDDKTAFFIIFDKKYNENYQIKAFPEALTDFFGKTNDTIKVNIKTKKQEEYAILKIKLQKQVQYPIILQLTNEKGNEIQQEIFSQQPENQFIMENILPGKYRLRLVEDKNNNQKWDTGIFLQQLEPEQVTHFNKLIELRANWEVEEQWSD